jgi:hypothetical protein
MLAPAEAQANPIGTVPGRFKRWYQGSPVHGLRNVGTTRFRNVIVEIKSAPAAYHQTANRPS